MSARSSRSTSTWVPNTYADERTGLGRADAGPPGHHAARRTPPAIAAGRRSFRSSGRGRARRAQRRSDSRAAASSASALFLIVFALMIGTCCARAAQLHAPGRGDQRGATRIATALADPHFAAWLLGARFWLDPLTEFSHFLRRLRRAAAAGCRVHLADVHGARAVCAPLQRGHPDVVEPADQRTRPRSARRPRHPRRHRRRPGDRDHRLRARRWCRRCSAIRRRRRGT